MKIASRLPDTKRLSDLLPTGREGGLEFARIVDLLLFHEARREGRNLTLFSDRSGDFQGLDSFGDGVPREDNRVGYQYKFFPSPLSAAHRTAINESLTKVEAANRERKSKQRVKKWVLVTPDDLTESGRRKDGGDVSWFEGLVDRLKLGFEVEHWGHRKLQALFLQTPSLCLFYYPELVPEGATRRKTIHETRISYITNISALYGRIEFVGMSVYKPEATRGVLMEHIYIPLATVSERANDRDPSTPRTNPMAMLLPAGSHHVILGDPGSGKSTLLKFLALAGSSKALQERYGFPPDRRLPILVVLRRYADALKSDPDLGLLDYILRNLQADLSLPHADRHFFEYYLESGEALLLFDGMDELPNPHFKKTVRDRIHCLLNTYPGNTAIVTSRIVGYENPHRFDDKTYSHHKMARLALPEMERFVTDWYAARIENEAERRANSLDLIRILHDSQHQAIGDLAGNPLLLTIIALVHRIDAVLPDERVVLYQKCTETLLNTWHTWKFRATEVQDKRGKIERRNRRRIEALAYWMHEQAGGGKAKERAVVTYDAARDLLVAHIRTHEPGDPDDSQDEAENFLEFVKSRAGLLIEVGDRQYSFVHLTFQEYLTATDLTARMELGGAMALWNEIASKTSDPRWHEVLRLLVAGLRSGESQAFLVKSLLDQAKGKGETHLILLLGGLLLDGIEAAEQEGLAICRLLINGAIREQETELAGRLISAIRGIGGWAEKERPYLEEGFRALWRDATVKKKVLYCIVWLAAALEEDRLREIAGDALSTSAFEWVRLLLTQSPTGVWSHKMQLALNGLFQELTIWADTSSWTNGIAALGEAVFPWPEGAKMSYQLRLSVIPNERHADGPFREFGHLASLVTPACRLLKVTGQGRTKVGSKFTAKFADGVLQALTRKELVAPWHQDRNLAELRMRQRNRSLVRVPDLNGIGSMHGFSQLALRDGEASDEHWNRILSNTDFIKDISTLFIETLKLEPIALWGEAIRSCLLPRIPQRLWLYQPETWQRIESAFTSGNPTQHDVYAAGWLLLYDLWLFTKETYHEPSDSPFRGLAELTRSIKAPPIQLAHLLRDIAHGDDSRLVELKALLGSDDPAYKELFRDAMQSRLGRRALTDATLVRE